MKFRPLSAVITLTIVGAGTLITGAPAQAASTKTCAVDQGAVYDICFDGNGDKFIVNDVRSDGMRAVVKWKAMDGSGRVGQCADTDGAFNGPKVCNYDFVEGPRNYVIFQGFVQDGPRGTPQLLSWAYNGYISPR